MIEQLIESGEVSVDLNYCAKCKVNLNPENIMSYHFVNMTFAKDGEAASINLAFCENCDSTETIVETIKKKTVELMAQSPHG